MATPRLLTDGGRCTPSVRCRERSHRSPDVALSWHYCRVKGVLPVSAFVARPELMEVFIPGSPLNV